MSDLFGNHIVGFPTRRLIYYCFSLTMLLYLSGQLFVNISGGVSTCLDIFQVSHEVGGHV